MRKTLLLLAGMSLSLLAFTQTYINSGTITESQVWTKANSPYHIMGDVTFFNNVSLTIEPGVHVIFNGYRKLTMDRADLFAVGSPADSILFTVSDTNGFAGASATAGGWKSIYFKNASTAMDTSRFAYCRFEYSKADGLQFGDMGIISANRNSRIIVENSLFINNRAEYSGVHFFSADITIRNNTFRNNIGQHCMRIESSDPEIYDNVFENNNINIIIQAYGYSPVIKGNLFRNNHVGHVIAGGTKPIILNNKIIDNYIHISDYAIRIEGRPYIENNLIANNDGGGIWVREGPAEVINNTVVNNAVEGIHIYEVTEGLISGNIVYGNATQVYYRQAGTEPDLKYNLFQGGVAGFSGDAFTGINVNNIDADPQFINPTVGTGTAYSAYSADFDIAGTSPCVNKGDPGYTVPDLVKKDLGGERRIKYGIVDIGAYEGNINWVDMPTTISSDLTLVADSIRINGNVTINDNVTLTLSAGSNVYFMDPYKITNKGTLIANGTVYEPMLIAPRDTTEFYIYSGGGGWKGIIMDNSNGSMDDNPPSEFNYCHFENFKNSDFIGGSVFYLEDIPEISFNNCTFHNNWNGADASVINSMNSKILLDNCIIESNVTNDMSDHGAFYLENSIVNISDCIFRDNESTEECSVIKAYGETDLTITNSFFYNNHAEHANANVLRLGSTNCRITNCVFANNKGRDAVLDFTNCTGYMNNCNIVNNWGGIDFDRGHLTISNLIYHGNIRHPGFGTAYIFLEEDNVDPDFYNCLIEGGIETIRFLDGFQFSGKYIDCIDGDPAFIKPTPDYELGYDLELSNWNLFDISPAINRGTIDTNGLYLPEKDLAGNPRILLDRIDIGAYEKEASSLTITKNPIGGVFCFQDTTVLSVSYSNTDTVLYQWIKDGVEIPGATDDSLTLAGLSISDEGNFVCRVGNALGMELSAPAFLKVNSAPEIIIQPESQWVEPGKVHTMKVEYTGTSPVEFRWMKDGKQIPGVDIPEYRFTPSDSSFEGVYTCEVSNACGTVITDTIQLSLAPQICMVTVSQTTGHNLIIWEKKTKTPLMAYNIYRESVAAGIYDLLETVSFDDLSVYTDTTADPTVQAYLYKITGIDSSEQETDIDLCKPHKTIHLIVSTNPELNTTQLQWDRYYGFDYQTYTIYRSSTGVNFDPVHSLSASLNSWTDPDPIKGDVYYRMAVEKPDPCYPEGGGLKAGTGPYQHALSNMDDNKLKAGENPPDSIMLDNNQIDENKLPGSLVGRLSTRDLDSLDYHTYHLVEGDGDDDNGSFAIMGDLLISANSFDFETQNSYAIRIRSTDNAYIFTEETFIITVNNTGESPGGSGESVPDSIMLSNLSIAENNLIGELVGRLTTSDPDTFDIHSYQLVAGSGDDDNSKFMILGDLLMAAHKFDFEDVNQFKIRIRSTDKASNAIEKEFLISIIDVDESVGVYLNAETGLRIYPNPFSESTSIIFPNPGRDEFSLSIIDLTGKTVFVKENIREDRFILYRNDLGKGYYILLLQGKQNYREKLIIE